MTRRTQGLALTWLVAVAATVARGDEPRGEPEPKPESAETSVPGVSAEEGERAFADVARVLQAPRCMNCHPAGDRPLQTDAARPHRFDVSRRSVESGLECSTCHQERNSEALGVEGGPPGAPHWGLPPAATPMVFQGKSLQALCRQLNDPAQTGGRGLADLLRHVSDDPLVQWAWAPGGKRDKPPLTHREFVAAFRTWVASGGACP